VPEAPGLVGLSAALKGLREELETAWTDSAGKLIRFGVNEVVLTVEAVVRKDAEVSGKIRWWVVEAGASGKLGTEATQTLVLTLAPGIFDKDGNQAPLYVSGEQLEPGK
jgi:hypothetical protein